MAEAYAEKFGRADYDDEGATGKPSCYGDLDTFDHMSRKCGACPVSKMCGNIVDRKLTRVRSTSPPSAARRRLIDRVRNASHSTTPTRSTARTTSRSVPTRTRTTSKSPPTVEIRDGDTFLSALVHNMMIEVVTSVLEEFLHAFDSQPRRKYPSIFDTE